MQIKNSLNFVSDFKLESNTLNLQGKVSIVVVMQQVYAAVTCTGVVGV